VAGTACLLGAVFLLMGCSFEELGSLGPRTVGICVLPLAFAVLSLAGTVRAIVALTGRRAAAVPVRLWVRLHATAVGLAAVGMSAYMAHHHLVGLRTWAW
jgi:hypothetical protein